MSAAVRTWWGFHQLTDDWARRLVDGAPIRPGDLVVDVGAGRGALTRPLVESGARVLAVEMHPGRARDLRAAFAHERVVVIEADAADLRLPGRPFHVVANPPFAITTALVRRLVSRGSRMQSATLVVPRYAAERWSSGRHHGAGRWAATFSVRLERTLPRAAFVPRSPGAVALLRIDRRRA